MTALPAIAALARPGALDRGAGAALLRATCQQGFSEPIAREGLQAELSAWRQPGAFEAVRGQVAALDPAGRPRVVLVIAARTLPVGALRQVLIARLLGARVLLKPARGQAALAEAIASADPGVTVRAFVSDDVVGLESAIAEADAVVALCSDEAAARIRVRVPGDTGFVAYGHRVSAAWLSQVGAAAAAGVAADLVAWDQTGCMAPQVLWVPGGQVNDAVSAIAAAVRAHEVGRPMTLSAAAAVARHAAATGARMRGGSVVATETALIASRATGTFEPSPASRFLWVLPHDAAALSQVGPWLSAVATDGTLPASLPTARLCAPGQMQRPPLGGPHDGVLEAQAMWRPLPAPGRP